MFSGSSKRKSRRMKIDWVGGLWRNPIPCLKFVLVPFHKSAREKDGFLMMSCKQKTLKVSKKILSCSIVYPASSWGGSTSKLKWYEKYQPLALRLPRAFCQSSCLPASINCWEFGAEICQKLLPYKFPLKGKNKNSFGQLLGFE